MQASGTEMINWGRTYMHTPDKYTEKNHQALYSTNQSTHKQVNQKFFKRLNFIFFFFFVCSYLSATGVRKVYTNVT